MQEKSIKPLLSTACGRKGSRTADGNQFTFYLKTLKKGRSGSSDYILTLRWGTVKARGSRLASSISKIYEYKKKAEQKTLREGNKIGLVKKKKNCSVSQGVSADIRAKRTRDQKELLEKTAINRKVEGEKKRRDRAQGDKKETKGHKAF